LINVHLEGDMEPLRAIVPIIVIWGLVLPIHDHCPNILVHEINVRKLVEVLVSPDLWGSHKFKHSIAFGRVLLCFFGSLVHRSMSEGRTKSQSMLLWVWAAGRATIGNVTCQNATIVDARSCPTYMLKVRPP
jgi:hypothetical protein